MDPQIEFPKRVFCFTGKSAKASRKQLATLISEKGGVFKDSIVRELDYLIVGADGDPCWAYSCYGRKIEQVIELRKCGFPMLLVHENDFWDFV
ncbi:MAG: BRCT domain-containing protein [Planctomycetaceae bacterium]|nr:BRCT domain-containing protein [Planctomycetaceae bacterium]